jgi:hypothetical protein
MEKRTGDGTRSQNNRVIRLYENISTSSDFETAMQTKFQTYSRNIPFAHNTDRPLLYRFNTAHSNLKFNPTTRP